MGHHGLLGRAPGHQGLQVEGTRAPGFAGGGHQGTRLVRGAPGFAREGTEAWRTLKIKEMRGEEGLSFKKFRLRRILKT